VNRRNFLKNIGFAGASLIVAPFVSFEAPKRMVYITKLPAFIVLLKKKGEYPVTELDTVGKCVYTYSGTLKEFCDRYPKDVSIFFYEERKLDNGYPCVRAVVFKPEDGMEIVETKGYEKMYI